MMEREAEEPAMGKMIPFVLIVAAVIENMKSTGGE